MGAFRNAIVPCCVPIIESAHYSQIKRFLHEDINVAFGERSGQEIEANANNERGGKKRVKKHKSFHLKDINNDHSDGKREND
ncbi:hypothetical protein MHBO_004310 [Bonamia ostreae]|uniref:Uncharacterized protein n=1 Tax=Bonamia ostreae TaxID=126728 RepID=A0ABV2ASZ3_9EUKA